MRPAFSTNAIGCTTPSANKDARASQNAVDETAAPTVALRAPREPAASIRSTALIRRAPTPAAASRPSRVCSRPARASTVRGHLSRLARPSAPAAPRASRHHRHRRRARNESGGMYSRPAHGNAARSRPRPSPLTPRATAGTSQPLPLARPPVRAASRPSRNRQRHSPPRPTSASAPPTPSRAAQRDASPAASPSSASATARSAATLPLPSSPSTRPAAPAQPSRLPNSAPSTSTASGYA